MPTDVTQLNAAIQNLQSRVPVLAAKNATNQPAVDAAVNDANTLDQNLVNIMSTPDPGPRTDLDFTALDTAVAIFKQNKTITQQDADNLAGLVTRNTPA